ILYKLRKRDIHNLICILNSYVPLVMSMPEENNPIEEIGLRMQTAQNSFGTVCLHGDKPQDLCPTRF
ncbi:MAG: hypothetical protein QG591_393, partial [Planctomycetota bacterium]|nr:hypothetical protein [Planctomycetota bacterium]